MPTNKVRHMKLTVLLKMPTKAGAARDLKKTCLPERKHKQQLAGLLGVGNYLAAAQYGGAAALVSLHFHLQSIYRLFREFIAAIRDLC